MILSYLGSKASIIYEIMSIMRPYIGKNEKFCDLFAGSGIVSHYMSNECYNVSSCDQEVYSYVLTYALTKCVYTDRLKTLITSIKGEKDGLVTQNFSPPARKFFTNENANNIDDCRIHISTLFNTNTISYKEYIFLLASLLCSCSKIANTCGTFRAYLKHFSTKALKEFVLEPVHTNSLNRKKKCIVRKDDVLRFIEKNRWDVVYMDPPHTNIHYGAYYSFLNYLCIYNTTTQLKGTGIIQSYNKSLFGMKKHAKYAFFSLFSKIQCRELFISYSSKSLLPIEQMINVIKDAIPQLKSIHVHNINHKPYCPNSKCCKSNVVEYLIHVRK